MLGGTHTKCGREIVVKIANCQSCHPPSCRMQSLQSMQAPRFLRRCGRDGPRSWKKLI